MDVVTVTLNPAIDHTVFLDRLEPGTVHRVRRHHRQAGGKGVNVSSLLADYGIPSTATGFLGRDNAGVFGAHLAARGIRDAFVRIPGETRTGIKIVAEEREQTTDLNFPGPPPGDAALAEMESALFALAAPGRWFVIGGSLPAGMDPARLGGWISRLRDAGTRVAVDTSGDALREAIGAGADLIKPNEHEFAEWLGQPSLTDAGILSAARELHARIPHIIVSLGEKGAHFLSPEAAWKASAPPVEVISTVGAGDALLAGYLAGIIRGLPAEECARLATAFAWSALESIDRRLPGASVIHARMREIGMQPLPEGVP